VYVDYMKGNLRS
ncbi:hypothetical protein POUND7_008529, partial [Theobroma cacao]